MQHLNKKIQQIYQWLLPNICLLCQNFTRNGKNICAACNRELPRLENTCYQCANPLTVNAHDIIHCGNCLNNPPNYDKTIAAFYYHQPITHVITALKFSKNLAYAKLASELLLETLITKYQSKNKPELIIPVPLHHQRLRERGFNQALEIAKPIGRKFNIPIDNHHCLRIINTAPQSAIAAAARIKNVKNAFQIQSRIRAKHIAIIDDVVTTGSTVQELSQTLKKNHIEKIDVWCVAKTQLT